MEVQAARRMVDEGRGGVIASPRGRVRVVPRFLLRRRHVSGCFRSFSCLGPFSGSVGGDGWRRIGGCFIYYKLLTSRFLYT